MTHSALALLLLTLPAHAGDTAPGAPLWPEEPRYEATVIEVATIGPLWGCMDAGACCGVHVDCGGWMDDPAPVPLPPTLLLLTAAIAALALKGKRYVQKCSNDGS